MEHNNQRGSVGYDAVADSERPESLPPTKCPALRSIGTWPTITLALSTVVLIAAIVFLAIFWGAALSILQGKNVDRFWLEILQSGRSAITITITSAFIRTAISLQAGVATSMLSSIIIERAGISLWKLPMLSIIRTISVGPQTLAWPLLRRPSRKTPILHLCIVLSMLVITIVAQFTSTILLSDFATETVVLPQNTTTVTTGFSKDDTRDLIFSSGGINYWNTAPSVFPRFAEYGETVETTEGVADTGLSLRAFIPFEDTSTRSSLRSYSGPARVLDARVICVRPILTDVLLQHPDDGDADHIRLISGTVALGVPYSTLNTASPGAIRFNCTIVTPALNQRTPLWSASLCRINYVAFITTNPLSPGSGGSSNFLVFNATGFADPLGWQGSLSDWTMSNSGAWTTMEGVEGDFALILSASLCFSNSLDGGQDNNFDTYNVEYSSNSDFIEPPLELRLSSLDYQPVADRIVDIFCGSACSSKTLDERGILAMKQQPNWSSSLTNVSSTSSGEAGSLAYDMSQGFYRQNSLYKGSNASLIIAIDRVGINSGHVFVFSTILRRTENPALGLQYLFTTVAQMAYYGRKPYYNTEATAKTVFSDSLLVPRRWTGFMIVAALAGVHLLLVAGIIAAFLATTRISLLGNSWMAVAQVLSQDTDDSLLDRASRMSDEEVREVLKSSGRDGIVRLPGPRVIGLGNQCRTVPN